MSKKYEQTSAESDKALRIGSGMRSYLPNIKILRKENFYTKEPIRILRIALFDKVWFYHLTFNRFL